MENFKQVKQLTQCEVSAELGLNAYDQLFMEHLNYLLYFPIQMEPAAAMAQPNFTSKLDITDYSSFIQWFCELKFYISQYKISKTNALHMITKHSSNSEKIEELVKELKSDEIMYKNIETFEDMLCYFITKLFSETIVEKCMAKLLLTKNTSSSQNVKEIIIEFTKDCFALCIACYSFRICSCISNSTLINSFLKRLPSDMEEKVRTMCDESNDDSLFNNSSIACIIDYISKQIEISEEENDVLYETESLSTLEDKRPLNIEEYFKKVEENLQNMIMAELRIQESVMKKDMKSIETESTLIKEECMKAQKAFLKIKEVLKIKEEYNETKQ